MLGVSIDVAKGRFTTYSVNYFLHLGSETKLLQFFPHKADTPLKHA